eukprot:m.81250 g.81250  ORF g.81250 m.81250 type:complete len:357 (-) comp14867_c0_seq1:323-1393(-)
MSYTLFISIPQGQGDRHKGDESENEKEVLKHQRSRQCLGVSHAVPACGRGDNDGVGCRHDADDQQRKRQQVQVVAAEHMADKERRRRERCARDDDHARHDQGHNVPCRWRPCGVLLGLIVDSGDLVICNSCSDGHVNVGVSASLDKHQRLVIAGASTVTSTASSACQHFHTLHPCFNPAYAFIDVDGLAKTDAQDEHHEADDGVGKRVGCAGHKLERCTFAKERILQWRGEADQQSNVAADHRRLEHVLHHQPRLFSKRRTLACGGVRGEKVVADAPEHERLGDLKNEGEGRGAVEAVDLALQSPLRAERVHDDEGHGDDVLKGGCHQKSIGKASRDTKRVAAEESQRGGDGDVSE